MKRMTIGLLVAAGLILVSHAGANWVRAGYSGQVRLPEGEVASLPTNLAGWEAVEDRPLDKRTADVLGAGDFVSRVYRNAAGETAAIHVAVWTDFREGPTGLHYPEVCFPNAGWQILGTQTMDAATPDGEQSVRLMLLEQSGQRIVTGHWYEMGDAVFFTRGEARSIQRSFWGARELPFVAKVLIQVTAPDVKTARPKLEELTAAIADWTRQL